MNAKLYLGPMSKNIVDAAIELINEHDVVLGFCTSRRQIDFDSGYVNNWQIKSFTKYVKDRALNVVICRDHAGPGQGVGDDDGFVSLRYDTKTMDIIHIDPWKKFRSVDEAIAKTAEYIEFCNNINNSCLYEVGTEEVIRKMTYKELYIFLRGLKARLGGNLFKKILYAVIQSGTSLKEDKNTGDYDETRLKKMVDVCKEFSVLSKEHNGDYLSSAAIKEKFNLGLDAINIAPEFGIIETSCLLNIIDSEYEIFDEIYQLCYDSGKWRKWVSDDFDPYLNKKQTIKICCHYVFSDKRFKNILKSNLFKGINTEIKFKVKNRIMDIINLGN